MPSRLPPYALTVPSFPFRHLAELAGRAPIGGAREVALACFMTARVVSARVGGEQPAEDLLKGRSTSARGWLGTLAIPATLRAPLTRCLDAVSDGSNADIERELSEIAALAGQFLDVPSRAELGGLVASLRA